MDDVDDLFEGFASPSEPAAKKARGSLQVRAELSETQAKAAAAAAAAASKAVHAAKAAASAKAAAAAPAEGASAPGGGEGAEDAQASEGRPTGKTCKHEVAMPPGEEPTDDMLNLVNPAEAAGRKPAKEYAFELDPFQKAAVSCIEREESVLVSAHTSAGKTVCAEYAIAVSLRDQQRVIYTSPIKALSNQKYRELYEKFGDVGLMTGDYTINVDASCLVMTTEILRSMLYRGSEVMREVKWVVFDEVHYMRDKERGVVWEEVMILLPHSVKYVFLSATVPNALQFSEWIAQLHRQPCHVVYTEYRPTPLQHYIFGAGSDGFHLALDENGKFKSEAFDRAASSIKPKGGRVQKDGAGKRKQQQHGPSDCFKLVKTVVSRGLEPLIVFAFGKKTVESLAGQMQAIELTSFEERQSVTQIFENATDTLSEDDRTLPQVEKMLPLLQRGVAVHHSGLLPLLKELVEILFQEGLVKLLFATETFAMGLNMPAKTVIFADLSKFDGQQFRILTSGEYIQMSGRAGRRGLDTRGLVITMIDEKSDLAKVKEMLHGDADKLSSRFHLSYNMLLNCVRVETADIEMLISKSFYTFQLQRSLPEMETAHRRLLATLQSTEWKLENETTLAELHATLKASDALKRELRPFIQAPVASVPFLQPGRLARFFEDPLPADGNGEAHDDAPQIDWGWGVIVSFKRRSATADPRKGGAKGATSAAGGVGVASEYSVDALLRCAPGAAEAIERGLKPTPPEQPEDAELQVLSLSLEQLDSISSVKVALPKDLRGNDERYGVLKVEKRFAEGGVPLLSPEDLSIKDERVPRLLRKLEAVHSRLEEPRLGEAQLHDALPRFRQKLALRAEERSMRKQIKEAKAELMRDELKGMRRVLRRLGHVSDEGVISNKGRVACEVSTSDELLVTELVFSGVFQQLEPSKLAALLSCLVAEHTSGSGGGGKGGQGKDGKKAEPAAQIKTPGMREPFEQLREQAKRVATVVQECKLPVDIDAYLEKYPPSLVDLVHDWCGGAKFADLCKMTDAYEGSIIRMMHRLEELLRQLIDAAKVVGNQELQANCEAAQRLLVRDVVFAQSLYT